MDRESLKYTTSPDGVSTLDTNLTTALAAPDGAVFQQLQWLRQTLQRSRSPWKVVVGHASPYTSGDHRGDDHGNLQQYVKPILDELHVAAYFAGHDHDLEHLKPSDGTPHYFVSGAGAKVRTMEKPDPSAVFAVPGPGFTSVSINSDVMAVDFIGYKGEWLHRTSIERPPIVGR